MSRLLLLASLLLMSAEAFSLECHGTEPFWAAQVSNEKIELSYPDETGSSFTVTRVESPFGVSGEYMSVYSDARGPLAVVTARECNNGMSDEIFPREVLIFTGTGTLVGCCE